MNLILLLFLISYIWNSDDNDNHYYKDADIRLSLNNDIYNIIDFKENIKSVKRHSYMIYYIAMDRVNLYYNNYSNEKIFLPSIYEVITENEIVFDRDYVLDNLDERFSHESKYPYYTASANLVKGDYWWLSTAYEDYRYPYDSYGAAYFDQYGRHHFTYYGDTEYGVSFCFCIGKSAV